MTRLAAILLTLAAGCATTPPLPPGYERPAASADVPAFVLRGPPAPRFIEWQASAGCPTCPHFAEMMDFAEPDTWYRIADDLFADTNGVIQCPTPGPGNFRCGVRY